MREGNKVKDVVGVAVTKVFDFILKENNFTHTAIVLDKDYEKIYISHGFFL
jgi:hypothetical protein